MGAMESDDRRQLRRAVIASTIGTTIEWYDFFLYSTVTGLVFAQLYFPKSDPFVGTLQAFAIYAGGALSTTRSDRSVYSPLQTVLSMITLGAVVRPQRHFFGTSL